MSGAFVAPTDPSPARLALRMLAWLLMPFAVAEAQPTPPNPCSATVHRITQDSVYAELQAPKGTKRCTVDVVEYTP